jgi:hypothetical protein
MLPKNWHKDVMSQKSEGKNICPLVPVQKTCRSHFQHTLCPETCLLPCRPINLLLLLLPPLCPRKNKTIFPKRTSTWTNESRAGFGHIDRSKRDELAFRCLNLESIHRRENRWLCSRKAHSRCTCAQNNEPLKRHTMLTMRRGTRRQMWRGR